jgi:hypothetical protein
MVLKQRTRVGFRGFRGLIVIGPRRGLYIGLNARWGFSYCNFTK